MLMVKSKMVKALNGLRTCGWREEIDKLEKCGSIKELYGEFKGYIDTVCIEFYVAYGSNMDTLQMDYRCPSSVLYDKVVINNYKFVLDSCDFASIVKSESDSVECLVWLCPKDDIKTLDRYEGVAYNCYEKSHIDVIIDGIKVNMLIYFSLREICTPDTCGYNENYMERIVAVAEEFRFSESYIEELKKWLKY